MSIFKAYDIRGTYPDQLDKELAFKIGRAFVAFLGVKNVVVAKDVRESSDELEESLIQGILKQGADVIAIGLATTPMMYFTVAKFGYDSGIMITASHNPKEYNGFKLVREQAIPISGDTGIKEIEKMVLSGEFPAPAGQGEIKQRSDILDEYILNALAFRTVDQIPRYRIVVDTGNGMGALIARKFFEHVKADVTYMYEDMDGTFPNHEANPLKEETLEDIRKMIKLKRADMGIAFDGDADRLFFLDEHAQVISCDKITALVARRLLTEMPSSTFLYDLRSSKVVKEVVEENGGTAKMCRVGHAFIKAQMREEDAVFAGELSGHFYFKGNNFFESPLFVTLKILEEMAQRKESLSQIIAPFNKYFASGEINSKVEDKDAAMKKLEEKYSGGKIIRLDGVSVVFSDWWVNVRPSNTEPLLRLNLEADSKVLMEQKRDEVLALIRS